MAFTSFDYNKPLLSTNAEYQRYYCSYFQENQPSNPKPMLQTLTSALKRALSPSLQSQYKAGLRNGRLELTEAGRNEILELIANEKEKELTAIANTIIDEYDKTK